MSSLLKIKRNWNDNEMITTYTGKRMRVKTWRKFISKKLRELSYERKGLKTFQEEGWNIPGWDC